MSRHESRGPPAIGSAGTSAGSRPCRGRGAHAASPSGDSALPTSQTRHRHKVQRARRVTEGQQKQPRGSSGAPTSSPPRSRPCKARSAPRHVSDEPCKRLRGPTAATASPYHLLWPGACCSRLLRLPHSSLQSVAAATARRATAARRTAAAAPAPRGRDVRARVGRDEVQDAIASNPLFNRWAWTRRRLQARGHAA